MINAPVVALALLVVGCGNSAAPATSAPIGQLPVAQGCPAGGDLSTAADIDPARLPDEATLAAWQAHMVSLGPRFTGSDALEGWHEFLAGQLAASGLTVVQDPATVDWWFHRQWSLKLIEHGVETDVPVASYTPYSGFTPDDGIVAEVVDAGKGLPTDLALAGVGGKIALYEEDMLPATAAIFYAVATYVHDPDGTLSPTTSYKRAAISFLTPQEETSLTVAAGLGSVGAIVSYEASADNAAGQYTPFLSSPGSSPGVPALYVDRATGDLIKQRIAAGAQARLTLLVEPHEGAATEDIIATLPGTNPDEVLIFNTHTDGTSSAEENGGIAVISLARYFASLPQSCRHRTMVFVLTPGHFNNGMGGDTDRFIEKHPEIIAKAVGSLTMEHLGQTEWVDDATGFHASGMVEPGAFFGSANAVQLLMKNAVIAEDLRRTFVLRPYGDGAASIYFGVGSTLNTHGVPNAAYITGPNTMLSFAHNQHLDKFDVHRMAAEIRTFARVATELDDTSTSVLCAGMIVSSSGMPSGCVP